MKIAVSDRTAEVGNMYYRCCNTNILGSQGGAYVKYIHIYSSQEMCYAMYAIVKREM